jgi:protein FAM50
MEWMDACFYARIDMFYSTTPQARGKSGPLFNFDVHEDVRMTNDVRVEKDESHPGKICERHWFERNKHIFPASRWEVYDPNVVRDRYTIHGDEVRKSRRDN